MNSSIFRLKINTQINTSLLMLLIKNLRTIFNSAIGLLYESRRSLYLIPPAPKNTHTPKNQKKKQKNPKTKTKKKTPKQNKHPYPMQNPPCPCMLAIYNDCTPTYCSLLVLHTCCNEHLHIQEDSVNYHSIICFHLFYRKPCFR